MIKRYRVSEIKTQKSLHFRLKETVGSLCTYSLEVECEGHTAQSNNTGAVDFVAANRLRVASSSAADTSTVERSTVNPNWGREPLSAETEAVEDASGAKQACEVTVVVALGGLNLVAALHGSRIARSDSVLTLRWGCCCENRGGSEDNDGELEEHL
jgi:hypothetical protein